MPRSLFVALVFATSCLRLLNVTWSEVPRSDVESENAEQNSTPPPLSIETLYHPKQRFRYVTPTAPAMRWITSESGSQRLLIKRKDDWELIDPRSINNDGAFPDRVVWHGAELLVEQVLSVGGIDRRKVESAVSSWIGSDTRSLDRDLLRIEDGIVLAGLKATPRWVTRQANKWQDPTLSPDGTQVAFVQENDLFVMHLASDRVTRITHDGSTTRLNGRLDWVYQEEIYGRGNFKAFWWSDDSRSLAFLRLDNSRVSPFTITTSRSPRGGMLVERYPKAGDTITAAELWVARLLDEPVVSVSLIPIFTPAADEEQLIVRVGWRAGAGELNFVVTNRLQNELTLWSYSLDATIERPPRVVLREHCGQWLEILGLPRWLPDDDFLWLSDLPAGRRRLWRISEDGVRRVPLTPDDFDVRELVAVDAGAGAAYLLGDMERGTMGQQLYRVVIDPEKPDASGLLTRLTGERPWHQVSLSPDHAWMMDRSSGLNQPLRIEVRSLDTIPDGRTGAKADTGVKLIHEDGLRLPVAPIEPQWPIIETPDQLRLPAYLIPPSSAAQTVSPDTRHPVLVEVYGGPLAPTVRDLWSAPRYLLHQLLAGEGIAVMVVDNRSSGGRGLADAWSIHRRVGKLETEDVLTAVEWLKGKPWVDAERIAIRGWSFGGFLTLHTMTHSDAFAAGIAGGSVTDWRNYDAFYTERYMGLPSENVEGYDATSTVKAAENLRGRVLMIHGELDDNVHLANTLQMAAALQKAGRPFDLMIYPESAHSVRGEMAIYHMMRTSIDFLRRELLK